MKVLLLCTLATACAHPVCPPLTPGAEAMDAPTPAPRGSHEGYDARLRYFPYPFAVDVLSVTMQGHSQELVYMDRQPAGEARGTVLLLHGKNFSGAYWERTMHALLEAGYRVIAPDQIGFGKSSKPTEVQYSFHEMARHTLALLDALEVGPVTVVGHSMGGMLATRLALTAPERVQGLVLMNPIGLEDWQRVVPYQSIDAIEAAERAKEPDDVRAYMRASYFDGQWDESYEPLAAIQVGWLRGPDAARIARVSALTYDMIFTQPVVHEFPDIAVPTLLVIGQRDRTAIGRDRVGEDVAASLGDYPTLGRRAAEAIPGAELVELEGVGHVPQFEAFEPTMEALLRFLGR